MRYHERGTERYLDGSLGNNDAERRIEQYFASIDRPLTRYGHQGASTSQAVATTWPPEIRHTPDYLGFAKFWEVKSCFKDEVILKVEDVQCLGFWDLVMPVWVAIYEGARDRIFLVDLATIQWACTQETTRRMILDQGTKGEKQAYVVQLHELESKRVANATEAAKVHSKGEEPIQDF